MDNSVTLSSILPPGSAFEFGGDKGKGKERAHHPSHGASSSPDHNIPQPTRGKVGPILKEFRAYLDAQFTEPARHHGSLGPHHDSGAKTDAEKSFDLAVALQGEYESENARIIAQQEILLQSYQGKFECGICLETCPDDSATSIDQCQHKCCRDCIRGYLVSKIEEHRFPVVCPICSANENQRDPGIIGEEIAVQIGLTQEQYQLWNELGVAVFSTVINCPKCEKSLVVDRDDYQANEIISCPLPGCRGHWCKKCSQITNPQQRHTCDGSAELDRLIDQQKWKRCPGCNTPTEKASGCNHMTCTSAGCNTHFCYLCGNLIVRSVLRDDIQRGVSAHYSTNCALFAH
ncbi:hypothetical protein BOTBODRAFT_121700 [Botryobasidium botryosum FD-172 SS1]|uniref:RBR-type E3 ubiquitin transferase n=1 Tax=Botryobasidium botryosum (strain FD-172 SS1) TaxID=930990 RepID=A0A067M376_BOTB1|nr:hypothetical protein BOTBODRAFT_121700 [Botryobasidium botryosum FD-172 SS1]